MRQKEGGRAQPLKEVRGRDATVIEKKRIWQKLGTRWQKSLLPVDLKPHYTSPKRNTDRHNDSSQDNHKRPKAGRGPIPRNPAP